MPDRDQDYTGTTLYLNSDGCRDRCDHIPVNRNSDGDTNRCVDLTRHAHADRDELRYGRGHIESHPDLHGDCHGDSYRNSDLIPDSDTYSGQLLRRKNVRPGETSESNSRW